MSGKYNKDYLAGLNLFKSLCKEYHINFRGYDFSWIPRFNFLLSENNACFDFWYNVKEQGMFMNILHCKSYFDITYSPNTLFIWHETEQSYYYWKILLHRIWRKWVGITENNHIDDLASKEKMRKTLL